MRRFFSIAIVATAAALMLWGCFKEVVGYTYYNIAVYEQTEQNGKTPRVEEVFSYAYYVDTTEWKVASWEDALLFRITNKTTGEVKDVPDRIGDFASGAFADVAADVDDEDFVGHVDLAFVHVVEHGFGAFSPDLVVTAVTEQSDGNDNVAFKGQLFLCFQVLFLELCTAAEGYYFVFADHKNSPVCLILEAFYNFNPQ